MIHGLYSMPGMIMYVQKHPPICSIQCNLYPNMILRATSLIFHFKPHSLLFTLFLLLALSLLLAISLLFLGLPTLFFCLCFYLILLYFPSRIAVFSSFLVIVHIQLGLYSRIFGLCSCGTIGYALAS